MGGDLRIAVVGGGSSPRELFARFESAHVSMPQSFEAVRREPGVESLELGLVDLEPYWSFGREPDVGMMDLVLVVGQPFQHMWA